MRILWTLLIVAALAIIVLLPKDLALSDAPRLLAQGGTTTTAPRT